MMKSAAGKLTKGQDGLLNFLMGTFVLGSLWGLSEVALGSALRAGGFPYTSGLLTGIGAGTAGMALALYRKPLMPVMMGLVAVLYQLLAVPVLHLSIMCKANSCLAVGLEALAFGTVAALWTAKTDKSVYASMATGASGALLAATAFFFIGMRVAPCPYLLSFAGNPGAFLVKEGLIWSLFSAALLPLGYLAGARLQLKASDLLATRLRFSYAMASTVIALCLAVSITTLIASA